jgi:hypothetical protein
MSFSARNEASRVTKTTIEISRNAGEPDESFIRVLRILRQTKDNLSASVFLAERLILTS